MLLEHKMKLRIKQLIEYKKTKKSHLSVTIGYNKGFVSTVLGDSKKFFNLEHIEKICAALDYPVAKLFEECVCLEEEKHPPPASAQDKVLLDIFVELTPADKLDVISFAGERRIEKRRRTETEALVSKKESAA